MIMNMGSENIKNGLLKRQLALEHFIARKKAFRITKERITQDLEETRIIWKATLEKLPEPIFNQ